MAAVKQRHSVLQTADPGSHHIPGYQGFCPQFKFQIGDTFGRTTNNLLQDNRVASSGCLVLTDVYLPPLAKNGHLLVENAEQKRMIRNRANRWGNQKLVENMVPGYTGFIPKSEHYFGHRYAVTCTEGISDFEGDCQTLTTRRSGLADYSRRPRTEEQKRQNNYQPPLVPIASKARHYISQYKSHHSRSPLYMDNNNPFKNFMSGYTGFVPRVRGQIGSGYPLTTNRALNEFTDDLAKQAQIAGKPIEIHRPEDNVLNPVCLFPVSSGLVPNYTGHIPGEKFRQGQTFGHSTKNALKQKQ